MERHQIYAYISHPLSKGFDKPMFVFLSRFLEAVSENLLDRH